MIHYTLEGPKHRLEIHEDKIKLVTKPLWNLFKKKNEIKEWSLQELSQFQINITKFVWGKLEWSTFEGTTCSFRFSTNIVMMIKIERYMHKLIIKNLQRKQNALQLVKLKKEKRHSKNKAA